MSWKPGDRLVHRFNPELGTGMVSAVEGRTVVVEFPITGTVLRLASGTDALEPLRLRPGGRAFLITSGEAVVIDEALDDGTVRLTDGRVLPEREIWPLEVGESPIERLAAGRVQSLEQFALRLDSLHLGALREAEGLGSFLGGRILLFPHQLYVAQQATRSDPVRWLLADEVGLGKTVEACLILNHLLCTGRADRTLVVAPDTLTVQWLGELWRKYHQVFVLLDDRRMQDVEREHGQGFNPFDVYRRVVVSIERLIDQPRLVEQAVDVGVDLLIVDEAHHLRRRPGHPGTPAYRAVAPIAAAGGHALLLTATPLEDDVHGFFRLLQLLRPAEFRDADEFVARLNSGDPLPACTSATRRVDIGGLPPRSPQPIVLDDHPGWAGLARLERELSALPAPHEVARRAKARKIRRALASGPALAAVLDPQNSTMKRRCREAAAGDPRLDWLVQQAPLWRSQGDKTLVFVAQRETLEWLRQELARRVPLRAGLFHEDLSPGQRDIEVAQFRLASGPSMLISTECGGEGRNFEFCTRLVMFDLPWNPMKVEQRIGRLDRIGRRHPVEIAYFRPPGGLAAAVVDLYEQLGLFREPLGGFERELAVVEDAVIELALSDAELDGAKHFRAIVEEAREARDRVQAAAYHELHRNRYRPEMAEAILARVPQQLEELTQDVVVAACEQLDLHIEEQGGDARHSVEFRNRSKVSSLPGVPGGSSFLGTFDREEAVRDEGIDFFATGHPLVEGILVHLEESPRGRVALLSIDAEGEPEGFGLLAIYRADRGFEAVAVDLQGRERPDWAARLTRRPLRSRRIRRDAWTARPGWASLVEGLARHLGDRGQPLAVALIHLAPGDAGGL